MDEYLSRRSGNSAGNSPIDTGSDPAELPVSLPRPEKQEGQPFIHVTGRIYDLDTYRDAKTTTVVIDLERNTVVSAMSNLDLQIREILSDHLERGNPAIGQDRLVDALVSAGESLHQESAEDDRQTTLTPREAQENVLLVLRLIVLAQLEQQEGS